VDSSKQYKSVVSFCSGYAGIERGLELAGVEARTVAYVEIEAFAVANLVAKMESNALAPAPIWSNLKTFPAHLFRDRVDILTGGYPCQPFSAAGKRVGKDDPRHLWPWIRQHIDTMRPVRCFFENVEGHISLGLREVIEELEGLGYATAWGIFSAAEVGAPHQRKRVYIMANSSSGSRGNSKGFVRGQDYKTKRSQNTDTSARSSENVADSNNTRQQPNQRQGQARYDAGRRGQELANAVSKGSQGWLHRRQDKERQSELRHFGRSGAAPKQQGQEVWDIEPRLGRVVDGCADRVDRLRLLGNGVVPQTAAQAWVVLERDLNA